MAKHPWLLSCLPRGVAETCGWRLGRQGLAWTSVVDMSEWWRWRVGDSVEHLLPIPRTVMLPGFNAVCLNRLSGVTLHPVGKSGLGLAQG